MSESMTNFTSLRARLVGTVFLAIAPAWVLMYYTDLPWTGFVVGLLALGAAWFGGERFILRQVRVLSKAARQLGAGDLSSRTGLAEERGELGELARAFDLMAGTVEERAREREQAEKILLNRSFQQTVVGALGQFAMVSNDISALLNQAVMLVGQTIEVEYCGMLELEPDGKSLRLSAGVGWRPACFEGARLPLDAQTEFGYTLRAGEPVVLEHLPTERRFHASPILLDHGVLSGITVAVSGHGQAFGLLGAYTSRCRKFSEDEIHFLFSVATLLAMAIERIRAQAELQKLAAFVQLNPNPTMELASDGTITYFNDAAQAVATAVGESHPRGILPPNLPSILHTCLSANQSLVRLETQIEDRRLAWSFHPVLDRKLVHCYVEDISDRLNLEAQLRQSQKMESVGQLAAGVAHDFNNMLTIIQGHAGMLTARPGLPAEMLDSTQAIYFAAERAAALTRQLLMFSRKNVMQPKPLDLREVVFHMSKMLQRLLGETISLDFHAPSEIPFVQADGGMVEQVIMNLAVNARDAMPKGGKLTINTDPVQIDENYLPRHPQARLGSFVCLRVTDTGSGMDQATMNRIFEPFFTTKEIGKGTGLGLATVYGIVKQHEGWIEVASEPGKGSTFSVFFPGSTQLASAAPKESTPATEVPNGKETILVVEDEPILRDMAQMILRDCGYKILEASSGVEALRVWERHQTAIDLVLTDMVMPEGMSGMDLAQKLHFVNPKLKIIFASGYSMDDIDTAFVRRGHAAFLHKPYTHVTLAQAVRHCLDRA
jgi:signal transduction histidine kinase/ActR/RegA family two-component response regulator